MNIRNYVTVENNSLFVTEQNKNDLITDLCKDIGFKELLNFVSLEKFTIAFNIEYYLKTNFKYQDHISISNINDKVIEFLSLSNIKLLIPKISSKEITSFPIIKINPIIKDILTYDITINDDLLVIPRQEWYKPFIADLWFYFNDDLIYYSKNYNTFFNNETCSIIKLSKKDATLFKLRNN